MFRTYRFIFLVRFFGYLIFFTGLLSLVFILGPLIQVEAKYRVNKIFGIKKTIASLPADGDSSQSESNQEGQKVNFADIKPAENEIIPISTEYGIVIEKIEANARVIPGVNPSLEEEYAQALTLGVAEALGSTLPGEPGNLYLFSHSTDAPWNIVRYNAIFYLLRELETGDRVIVFHQNKRFDYIVYDKTIAAPTDVSYLTNKYNVPVLTLQTCDPPGTLINRLVVRAKLVNT